MVNYADLGDLLQGQGHTLDALSVYQKASAISDELRLLDPQSDTYARNVATSFRKLGEVHCELGQFSEALEYCKEALAISKGIYERAPESASSPRNLLMSYNRMALIAEKSGTEEPRYWWRKAYEFITSMKEQGILSPSDEKYIETFRKKQE